MNLVYDEFEAVCSVVSKIVFGEPDQLPEPCTAIGVEDQGKIIGGVIYHDYCPRTQVIEMTCGFLTPKWATKKHVHALLSYPFDQIGCQSVFTQSSVNNTPSVRLMVGLGFGKIRLPNLFGRGEDGFVFHLTDDAWRASKWWRKEIRNG